MVLTADAIVVGGGVIGASIAYHLTLAGQRVVLCEQGGLLDAGATPRSAGLVRMHHTNREDARLTVLGFPTFERWPEVVGGSCGFRRSGFLMVVGPEHADALASNVKWLADLGADTCALSPEELVELEPGCNPAGVGAAAYEPRSGYADPAETTLGFVSQAVDHGLQLVTGTKATSLTTGGGRLLGVDTTMGRMAAPAVVVATSAWAGELLAPAGMPLPLRSRQISVCVLAGGGAAVGCTFIDDTVGTYFRPHEHGVLVGVPTERWDVGRYADPPLPSLAEAEAAGARAARRLPALRQARVLERSSGFDGYTPDRRPVIGPAPGLDGCYLAVGFSGVGFKMAPGVGQTVAAELSGGPPRPELAPYRPERWLGAGGEPAPRHDEDAVPQAHRYRHM